MLLFIIVIKERNLFDPSMASHSAKTRSLTSQKIDINYLEKRPHLMPVEDVTSLIESETDSLLTVSRSFLFLF